MRRFTHSIMACLIGAVSQTTLAGNEEGFYVGASYGASHFHSDEDSGAYKVFGGYNFDLLPTLDLAVEAAYVDFGETSGEIPIRTIVDDESIFIDGHQTTSTTGWNVFGVADFTLGPVSLFGKLGMTSSNSETELSIAGRDNVRNTETGLAYGAGIKTQLSIFSIRAEYEAFDAEQFGEFDMLSIGVSYSF